MAEFAELDVGPDRIEAELVAAACRAEGLRVELLTADDEGTFPMWGLIQHHRLLIRAEDRERVESVVRLMRSS